jgi:hypothetical protein
MAAALVHHPWRHALVGEAEAPGLPGIDRLAGEHHVQRRLRADPLRQPQHAAPAGNDAQHDLGQAHPRRRLIDRQQVTTGQRQFESAAKAMAAHQRQRRIRDTGQTREELPAARHQLDAFLGRVELGELLDVCAGDETGGLAGAENQRLAAGGGRNRRAALRVRPSPRWKANWSIHCQFVQRHPRQPFGIDVEPPVLACCIRIALAIHPLSSVWPLRQAIVSTSMAPP